MTQNSFGILSDIGPEDGESLGSALPGSNDQMAESGPANRKQKHLTKSLIWIDLEMTGTCTCN